MTDTPDKPKDTDSVDAVLGISLEAVTPQEAVALVSGLLHDQELSYIRLYVTLNAPADGSVAVPDVTTRLDNAKQSISTLQALLADLQSKVPTS